VTVLKIAVAFCAGAIVGVLIGVLAMVDLGPQNAYVREPWEDEWKLDL